MKHLFFALGFLVVSSSLLAKTPANFSSYDFQKITFLIEIQEDLSFSHEYLGPSFNVGDNHPNFDNSNKSITKVYFGRNEQGHFWLFKNKFTSFGNFVDLQYPSTSIFYPFHFFF